jgi:hypothetical protein
MSRQRERGQRGGDTAAMDVVMKGIVAMTAALLVALVLTSLLAFGLDRRASLEADENNAASAASVASISR